MIFWTHDKQGLASYLIKASYLIAFYPIFYFAIAGPFPLRV